MLGNVGYHAHRTRIHRALAALLIGCVVFVFLSTTFVREAIKDYWLRKEIRRLETDLQATRSEGERLRDLLGTVTSQTWKEERARRELNLKRPGERVVIIADVEGRVAGAKEIAPPAHVSNLRKWFDYFFAEP